MRFETYLLTGAAGLDRLASPLGRDGARADGVVTQ